MQLRLLDESDRSNAIDLLSGDPAGGGLIHGLIVRHGFQGSVEHWGMYEDMRMVGIMSPDRAGRCPVFGAGPEWSEMIAGLVRYWWRGGRRLESIDVSAEIAGPLAAILPPVRLNELEIWECRDGAAAAAVAKTSATSDLTVRVAGDGDEAALTALYADEPSFNWVDVPGVAQMCRDGHRLWLVGEVAGTGIVAAAWANTLEPGAGRVSGVVTRPAWRGRGIATELVRRLNDALLAQGRIPYLYVSVHEPAAQAVYAKLGYRMHSRRVGLIYGGGH